MSKEIRWLIEQTQ
jgi:hypothetical protein